MKLHNQTNNYLENKIWSILYEKSKTEFFSEFDDKIWELTGEIIRRQLSDAIEIPLRKRIRYLYEKI